MRLLTFIKKSFVLLLLLLSTQAFAVTETQIKAIFLEKFTHLVSWPETTQDEFLICVLNDKKFADALELIYKTKRFKNRPVRVLRLRSSSKIPKCHLLFLGEKTKRTKNLLKKIQYKPILTVSDEESLLNDNIMISIFLKQKKFKYIINNAAAQDAAVKISYLLLQSAQKVIK